MDIGTMERGLKSASASSKKFVVLIAPKFSVGFVLPKSTTLSKRQGEIFGGHKVQERLVKKYHELLGRSTSASFMSYAKTFTNIAANPLFPFTLFIVFPSTDATKSSPSTIPIMIRKLGIYQGDPQNSY